MSKIIAIMLLLCCGMMLFGCADDNGRRKAEQQKTIVVTDSVGRKVELPYPLERVAVCNVYNAELITAVGAIDKIVGVIFLKISLASKTDLMKHRYLVSVKMR